MWSVEVEGRERGSEGLTYEKSGYEKMTSDNLTRPRQKSQGRFSEGPQHRRGVVR
jgi:hypothetical protein